MINEKIAKRFAELETQMNGLRMIKHDRTFTSYDSSDWQQWSTSVQNLLRSSFGDTSPHYTNFTFEYAKCKGWEDDVNKLKGIFRAAKDDYAGGYLFSMQVLVSGEIYGDFTLLAKTALTQGLKDVAAVLACAALEDALKRFALMHGLEIADKEMQAVVNALKAKGLVGGAQKTLLEAMPKIRNYAMHANWDKITPQDVGSVIGFVEQFLIANFS